MAKTRHQREADLVEKSIKSFNEIGDTKTGVNIPTCQKLCHQFRRKAMGQSSNEGRCFLSGETVYTGSTACERR